MPVNGSVAAAPIASRGRSPPSAIGPVASPIAVPSPWPGTPRRSESARRDTSSIGSRKVPVQVPPCQMLNTAIPVSAYQLTRMLREPPRTSKKMLPSRGRRPESGADMLPMVAPPAVRSPAERLSTSYRVGPVRLMRDLLGAAGKVFRARLRFLNGFLELSQARKAARGKIPAASGRKQPPRRARALPQVVSSTTGIPAPPLTTDLPAGSG